MKNKDLEQRASNILKYGEGDKYNLIIDLCQEIERLEKQTADVKLLRAQMATEILAAINVGKSLEERAKNYTSYINSAILQADVLINKLAKTEPQEA